MLETLIRQARNLEQSSTKHVAHPLSVAPRPVPQHPPKRHSHALGELEGAFPAQNPLPPQQRPAAAQLLSLCRCCLHQRRSGLELWKLHAAQLLPTQRMFQAAQAPAFPCQHQLLLAQRPSLSWPQPPNQLPQARVQRPPLLAPQGPCQQPPALPLQVFQPRAEALGETLEGPRVSPVAPLVELPVTPLTSALAPGLLSLDFQLQFQQPPVATTTWNARAQHLLALVQLPAVPLKLPAALAEPSLLQQPPGLPPQLSEHLAGQPLERQWTPRRR
mmetsp:Transcript_115793/g.223245  ORF Transcript_115793/g.223245 Transcript_115793/m.223245 type:complete len:274 (-) Transcript_115793:37-858(-)